MKILYDQELKNYNTIQIGGKIKKLFLPKTLLEIIESIWHCKSNDLAFIVVAGGSNLVFPDQTLHYNQAVICLKDYNQSQQITSDQNTSILKILSNSGTILQTLVDQTLNLKSGAMVNLNRIPGTIGGAVVGNAGAYGSEIRDLVTKVYYIRVSEIRHKDQKLKIHCCTNSECRFGYRDSIFKHDKDRIVVNVEFELQLSNQIELDRLIYDQIAKKRDAIYPLGYASPGSLFKNLLWHQQPPTVQAMIPKDWIVHGNKLPIGKLLEELNLKGFTVGGVQMTDRHPNIMLNFRQGNYQDALTVLRHLQQKVHDKFGINIEPEVLFVDDKFPLK